MLHSGLQNYIMNYATKHKIGSLNMKSEVIYNDNEIIIRTEVGGCSFQRSADEAVNEERINDNMQMFERQYFYESEAFNDDFNRHLETVILATRHGGSGARACRDALLSLYNGTHYKANLTDWYSLDSTNKTALLFILEHQTNSNRKDIDLYLPEYASDFARMKNEISNND